VREARQGVFEARELGLEDGLPGARPRREDPDDELLAVYDREPGKLLPVPLLARREDPVRDDGVRLRVLGGLDDLGRLPVSEEVPRRGGADLGEGLAGYSEAQGIAESLELLEGLRGVRGGRAVRAQGEEECLVLPGGEIVWLALQTESSFT